VLTWGVVFGLAVGVYGQRAVGMAVLDPDRLNARWRAVLSFMPLAILCAVVGLQTFTRGGELTLDARVWGVGAAVVCAWRRLPMFAIVIIAAVVTALTRAIA
jgi:branched-subunit amino acid transport protein